MKYIMIENAQGHKIPVIFPDKIVHADMAKYVRVLLAQEHEEMTEVVSAGFVSVKAECSGKSETLQLESDSDDSMYINFNDYIGTVDLSILPRHVLQTLKDEMK